MYESLFNQALDSMVQRGMEMAQARFLAHAAAARLLMARRTPAYAPVRSGRQRSAYPTTVRPSLGAPSTNGRERNPF